MILAGLISFMPLSLQRVLLDFRRNLFYKYLVWFDKSVKAQRANPLSIPVIIVNYNQLENLKKLIDFLIARGVINIVVIDNASGYEPLKAYYRSIESKVKIEYMTSNKGHMVFFKSKTLQKKYGRGYFILTDPDILPDRNCPEDLFERLISLMDKYYKDVTKVGLALGIDNIPDFYLHKERVIKWEKQFWEETLEPDIYVAAIDTTFAMYKPQYPRFCELGKSFFNAIRIGGKYTGEHAGWHINNASLSEEQLYYAYTAHTSNSWKYLN